MLDLVHDFRNDLGRTGAAADHCHSLPRQIDVVPPSRGMPIRALEIFQSGDAAKLGPVQVSNGMDNNVGRPALKVPCPLVLGLNMPNKPLLVPAAVLDVGPELSTRF